MIAVIYKDFNVFGETPNGKLAKKVKVFRVQEKTANLIKNWLSCRKDQVIVFLSRVKLTEPCIQSFTFGTYMI